MNRMLMLKTYITPVIGSTERLYIDKCRFVLCPLTRHLINCLYEYSVSERLVMVEGADGTDWQPCVPQSTPAMVIKLMFILVLSVD